MTRKISNKSLPCETEENYVNVQKYNSVLLDQMIQYAYTRKKGKDEQKRISLKELAKNKMGY